MWLNYMKNSKVVVIRLLKIEKSSKASVEIVLHLLPAVHLSETI